MQILYGFLTVLMFLDCVLLILLVLVHLPKKEAGAGMAFGGAATDALFGAGSGNVLTKITKYVAGIFFGLAIIMALMASHRKTSVGIEEQLLTAPGIAPVTAPASPGSAPATVPSAGPFLQLTNAPAVAP